MIIKATSDKYMDLLIRYLFFCIVTLLASALVLNFYNVINLTYNTVVLITTTLSILGMLVTYKIQGFSFSLVYLMYLSLAHLGAVSTELLLPGSYANFTNVPGWFNASNLINVVQLVGISIYFFIIGVYLGEFKNIPKNKKNVLMNLKGNQILYYVGLIFILIYLFVLIIGIITGLIPLGSYSEYRESKFPGYVWFLFLFRIGVPFSFATGNYRQIKIVALIMTLPIALIFLLGSRGEIIYPMAIGVSILIARGLKLKSKHIVIFLLIFFLLIPLVAQTRGDFTTEITDEIDLSLTDPFIEAGTIIRPFAETYSWIDKGEELAKGKTYIIPIQRFIGYLPIMERPTLEGSRYFLTERTPTQGYSSLAEAYFNFGILGIIFFPLIISTLLNKLRQKSYKNLDWLAFSGGLMVILMSNIRGHFLAVPAHLFLLTIIFLSIYFFDKYYKEKRFN